MLGNEHTYAGVPVGELHHRHAHGGAVWESLAGTAGGALSKTVQPVLSPMPDQAHMQLCTTILGFEALLLAGHAAGCGVVLLVLVLWAASLGLESHNSQVRFGFKITSTKCEDTDRDKDVRCMTGPDTCEVLDLGVRAGAVLKAHRITHLGAQLTPNLLCEQDRGA